MRRRVCVSLGLVIALLTMGIAQEAQEKTTIQKLLDANKIARADQLIKQKVAFFTQRQQTDSLAAYVGLVGDIAEKKGGTAFAKQQTEQLVRKIESIGASPAVLREAFANLGEFYGATGDNKRAYEAHLRSLSFALQSEDTSAERMALIQHNLGEYARRMANPDRAREHFLTATSLILQQPHANQKQLYQTFMSLGILSWYASKLDSAEYFFNKSIEAVQRIDDSPVTKYFRQALLLNNLAGVYGLQGRTAEAIRSMESCIALLREFLSVPDDADKKRQALTLQFEAIDNLGGAYKELGNYAKAEQLLSYSFEQKKQWLQADDPAIFISHILLGQLYYATSDYKKAIEYLTEGRQGIAETDADYLFWDADACYTLAMIQEKQQANGLAETYYRKADSLYALAFGDTYDNIYLEFLRKYASFQAKVGQCETATALAVKTRWYVNNAGNERSLLSFYQLKHLGELAFECGDFQRAHDYAQQALTEINRFVRQSTTLEDSIKTEGEKVYPILTRARASYELSPTKHAEELQSLLCELSDATEIIERKKRLLTDQKDIVALIASYQAVTDFIKQLHFEIYLKTNDSTHLNKGLNVHEEGIYSRLRSRMDYQRAMRFTNVPDSVVDQENRLKENIRASLQQNLSNEGAVRSYRHTVDSWHAFLKKLQRQYPAYYRMRYADERIALCRIGESVPAGVTVIRYLSSGEKLFAFVASATQWALVPLSSDGLSGYVQTLRDFGQKDQRMLKAAHQLYKVLWQPLESSITGSRVIVIPDGLLHHVSFDMLVPKPIGSLRELKNTCLLNKYAISYHYSLLALENEASSSGAMKANFVAFAPIFSDRSKSTYLAHAQKDSLHMDRTYAKLLPLPFTAKLVQKMQREFGGNLFMENESTAQAFRLNAAYHRIIHIGTHAEANNDYPEYSRLIFMNDGTEGAENSLYLYDIYNCDLTANIAVLAACETGKSGHLDGEGMISLAHAFRYAGSESILAGLWKIDEQSSTMIIRSFYENLRAGVPKDVALQRAKLAYLSDAGGRLFSPRYWAGLAILGNVDPVVFKPSTPIWHLVAGVFGIALFLAGAIVHRKAKRNAFSSTRFNRKSDLS